jgi:23S rRNA pseudouridine1911/1915/1917 synthase
MAANVKNGKNAVTHYQLLRPLLNSAHVELKLETGRTHQIRVHLSQLLHTPILCDPLYGSGESHIKKLPDQIREKLLQYPYQLLHAKELGFVHPITKERIHFSAPAPSIFHEALEALSL